ncbi:DUF6480 family protein [Kitasatospora sp. NPDC001132]
MSEFISALDDVMTTPDPEPDRTPALDEHGALSGEDTPLAEGGISGISPGEPEKFRKVWVTWAAILIVLFSLAVLLVLVGIIIAVT